MRIRRHLQWKREERVLGAAKINRLRFVRRAFEPESRARFQHREVDERRLRQSQRGAVRFAGVVEDRRLGLRAQSGRHVFAARFEKVTIDIGIRRRAGIGGIDDVDAAEGDRGAPGGDVEIVVQEDARKAADLQHFVADSFLTFRELRQADAEAADRRSREFVGDRDDRRDAPLRQIAAQPERVREIVEIHVAVIVGKNRREIGAREFVVQRVFDHRAKLRRFTGDERRVGVGDEMPRAGAFEDRDRRVDRGDDQQRECKQSHPCFARDGDDDDRREARAAAPVHGVTARAADDVCGNDEQHDTDRERDERAAQRVVVSCDAQQRESKQQHRREEHRLHHRSGDQVIGNRRDARVVGEIVRQRDESVRRDEDERGAQKKIQSRQIRRDQKSDRENRAGGEQQIEWRFAERSEELRGEDVEIEDAQRIVVDFYSQQHGARGDDQRDGGQSPSRCERGGDEADRGEDRSDVDAVLFDPLGDFIARAEKEIDPERAVLPSLDEKSPRFRFLSQESAVKER